MFGFLSSSALRQLTRSGVLWRCVCMDVFRIRLAEVVSCSFSSGATKEKSVRNCVTVGKKKGAAFGFCIQEEWAIIHVDNK